MKAMILAAGLGSRLRPLTDETPKALLKVTGKPLLSYAIEKLAAVGVTDIIVNAHHHAEQIERYVTENPYPDINLFLSDEKDQLLNTGGALKKAQWFFAPDENFFLYNADILTNINLLEMMDYHLRNNALATLAVSERITQRYFLFDEQNILRGWTNIKTGELIPESLIAAQYNKLAFSGIHLINSKLFSMIEKTGTFSIVPEYLRLCRNHTIMGYNHTGSLWLDIGKPEFFSEAEFFINKLSDTE
ncbi:MAG: nucleotidyltransferase family protein [Bacteroidales bacterium]|jgi:NDP-sugar pyrophosphorylase family protein|nr:nucleotidyltransferase family protein [Bacteroidales bacterium]